MFTLQQLFHELALEVDRGRVSQAFPLEEPNVVATSVGAALERAAQSAQRVCLTAPPGAGKSWALEALARSLRDQGWIVARHYCFLEPGDPDVGRRVALETMSALTSEILDDPRLADLPAGIAGDIEALERVLEQAAAHPSSERIPDHEKRDCSHETPEVTGLSEADPQTPSARATASRVALIVDGLDHVSRVEPDRLRPSTPTDFASTLASLQLPESTTLFVGSQPGNHLLPFLQDAAEIEIPLFTRREVARQLIRPGLFDRLREHGFNDERGEVFRAIVE